MDKDRSWTWFSTKPYKEGDTWLWTKDWGYRSLTRVFNIAPFNEDWKDSLIKVEHKEEE